MSEWARRKENEKIESEIKNGNLNKALKVFLNLCKIEPEWAEPFNKVATIKFLQKDYLTSIKYIKLTLMEIRQNFISSYAHSFFYIIKNWDFNIYLLLAFIYMYNQGGKESLDTYYSVQ